VAGVRAPGKRGGDVRWHGSQAGRVALADRQIQVKRPRLRHKQEGEGAVPAYEALQDNGATAERMMGALLRGVSTRQYEEVLPEMAGTVGVSRSSISRQAIEGGAEQLRVVSCFTTDRTASTVVMNGQSGTCLGMAGWSASENGLSSETVQECLFCLFCLLGYSRPR
jgi:hypothetical protein